MATSGTTAFTLDLADIMEEAYDLCGSELRSGYDYKGAKRALNLIFLEWQNKGLNLWKIEQATQTLTAGTTRYAFPTDAKLIDFESFRIKENATLGNDTKKLALITYDEYLEKYVDQEYAASQTRALPRFVFHGPDLKYGLVEPPDQAYTLVYDYYVFQADIDEHGDTMVIPDRFKHVVVDAAMFHAFMCRGNTLDAVVLKERADEGIKAMRSMLINRYHYMRSYMIPAATGGRRLGSARSTAGSSLDSL